MSSHAAGNVPSRAADRLVTAPAAGSPGEPLTLVELGQREVSVLSGAGPQRTKGLATMGIESLLDLMTFYPRRYLDRTRHEHLADMAPGDEAVIIGRVTSSEVRRTRQGRSMVVVDVADGTARVRVTFFNQQWRQRQLSPGTDVALFGRLEVFRGTRQMTNPVVDLIGNRTGRIVPVYPQSERSGLSSSELAELVGRALQKCQRRGVADPVPSEWLDRWGLIGRWDAMWQIHHPESMSEVEAARQRLVFDELLRIQLSLVRRKRLLEASDQGIAHATGTEGRVPGLARGLIDRVPFELTGAQRRVIGEIEADLARALPMHRLLQGDVGAGKTLVAAFALLVAVQGGHQGAFMAPTDVLAAQHADALRSWFADVTLSEPNNLFGSRPLHVELLSQRVGAADRRRILAGLADGSVDVVVGTHAVIQDAVEFRSLGVAVVDEQHRFGVEQRAALRAVNADGTVPDVLVMTATPIPRTAAMTVYGDLDVSTIDELPPGRTPIVTRWANTDEQRAETWHLVRDEVARGHQAFVVCPLVDESEKVEVASVAETLAELQATELAGLRLGVLHGRLPAAEKAAVMESLRSGDLDVLVATTVIEVGVDVPNATVMVILDADRFGIAQLHQLRGRVGRGTAASTCVLVAEDRGGESAARLEALVRSTDGFELAEVDLELRGEGSIMGARQKGRSDLKLASLRRDRAWVQRARECALTLVGPDGSLDHHPLIADEIAQLVQGEEADYLLKN